MNSAILWTLVNVLALLVVSGVGAGEVSVFVMEGDSVTLYTDSEANQHEKMRWYFNDIQIAVVIRDVREICIDDECKVIFRDRLKLDHQTGSLTITNITNTDTGVYKRKVIKSGSFTDKIFSVSVHDVPQRNEVKRKSVKEGESVTLDPGVVKNLNDLMWYFYDILIAKITGDQSKICTDDQCNERFRDRLELDNQTGSLTISNTRTTDSGDYKLQINSSSFSISRISAVLTVIAVPDSGLSPAAVAGIIVGVLLIAVAVAAAVVSFYCKNQKRTGTRTPYKQDQKGVFPGCGLVGSSVVVEGTSWVANGSWLKLRSCGLVEV